MKNNVSDNKINFLYKAGIFIILALPLISISPFFYPPDWPKAIVLRIVLSLLVFLLFYSILFKKYQINALPLQKNPIIWSLGALLLFFLMAVIFSVDPYFSFWGSPHRGGGFLNFLFYFLFAIIAFLFIQKKDWRKIWDFNIIIALLICIVAFFQLYGIYSSFFEEHTSRPGSSLGNPIYLGIYLLLLFFLTVSFFILENNKKKKIFYGFSFFVFLITIFITGSRGAYLGLLIGVFYFLLTYPKRIPYLKIVIAGFICIIIASILFVTFIPLPPFILENQLLSTTVPRLSLKALAKEGRFGAWQTAILVIKEKPILGWGPENFSIGWDKYYSPEQAPWWDKAHNTFLDIGAETGILGLITYLGLFVVLFFQLYKIKNTEKYTNGNTENTLIAHGISASLVGYLIANFFSFDSFATYLIFFLIVAYVLYLTQKEGENNYQLFFIKTNKYKTSIISILGIFLALFLWNYNIIPFYQNIQINLANNSAKAGECDTALDNLENIISKSRLLNSYGIKQYGDIIQKCSNSYPEKHVSYAKKALPIFKKAVEIQPTYTRFWLLLGGFSGTVAGNEENIEAKNELIRKAYEYLKKAEELSPNRPELFIERAKLKFAEKKYDEMKQEAEKCLELNPSFISCIWTKSIADIYLNNIEEAKKGIELGKFRIEDNVQLAQQLIDAYLSVEGYEEIAIIYERLVVVFPDNVQYYAFLAESYRQSGQYQKAKETALRIIGLVPIENKQQADKEVNAFIQTLPPAFR